MKGFSKKELIVTAALPKKKILNVVVANDATEQALF